MIIKKIVIGILLMLSMSGLSALTIEMFSTQQAGLSIGTIEVVKSHCGILLTPHLRGLTPGIHGFHLHDKPDCKEAGMAAGGHYDPNHTGQHQGPFVTSGHKGDFPVLFVNSDGTATLAVNAPLFKLSDLKNHALMIHEGGDNYQDSPQKLGGGGKRVACGVIE